MIREIYDIEELKGYVSSAHGAQLTLTNEEIKKWKKNNYFKYVKSQLENLNIVFSCVQLDNMSCTYFFIVHSEKLAKRIFKFLRSLKYNIKMPLVKYDDKFSAYYNTCIHGNIKNCNIFK